MIPVAQRAPNRPSTVEPTVAAPPMGRHVELWIQPLPGGGHEEHETLEAVLDRLERRGEIDGFSVFRWDREVTVGEGTVPTSDRRIARRIKTVREWARATGARVPAFEDETTVGTGRMGPERNAVRTPTTALLVFEEGVLVNVVPAIRDGHRVTVTEWVDSATTDAGIETLPIDVP